MLVDLVLVQDDEAALRRDPFREPLLERGVYEPPKSLPLTRSGADTRCGFGVLQQDRRCLDFQDAALSGCRIRMAGHRLHDREVRAVVE